MKFSRIVSAILVAMLICFSMFPAYSAINKDNDIQSIQAEYENELNKVHFYFADSAEKNNTKKSFEISQEDAERLNEYAYIDSEMELESAVENMKDFYEQNTDGNTPIKITVEFKSDFYKTDEFSEYNKKREKLKTMKEVRAFRKEFNAFSKEYHRREAEKMLDKLDGIDYESVDIIDYSPFVVLDVNKDHINSSDILDLARDSSVSNISLLPEENEYSETASWDRTLKETGAYSTVHSGLYTGSGVKVGILEVGICDVNHSNFTGKTIVLDPACNYNSEVNNVSRINHANAVVSIICKMAPDAEIYVSNNISNGLSWFIDQGCDVVNCSYSTICSADIDENGEFEVNPAKVGYNHEAALFDYQIKANLINVVASAGNINNDNTTEAYNPGYITSPGLAYNAITVGGLECYLGFLDYKLKYDSRACYITADSTRTKPEISAPYTVEIPNMGTWSGTSFSAPLVTACLALLFEQKPAISTTPSTVKAMLMATANKTENYNNISGSYFDEKVGAGVVNLEKMRNCNNITYASKTQSNAVTNGVALSRTISLSRNDELQVGLNWLATVDRYAQQVYITNYEIKIYNPSGTLVCSSTLDANSNVEMVRYKATSAGEYTVSVYQNGAMPENVQNDYISLVCYVD